MARLRKIDDWGLKEKVLMTLGLLLLYRVGTMVPLPFVNAAAFRQGLQASGLDGMLVALTMVGGSFSQLGVLSLGVMPYITASIIFQLLKVVVPRIAQLQEDQSGRKQVTQWTRYLTVVLALLQGASLVVGMPSIFGFQVFTTTSPVAYAMALFALVVGSLMAMRLGEEITLRGISNGISLIIFTSILAGMPSLLSGVGQARGPLLLLALVLVLLAVLGLVVYVEKCEYRVKVIYSKSSQGTTVRGSILPIKVALAGVLPVIFASSLLAVPGILGQAVQEPWAAGVSSTFAQGTWAYNLAFILLTIVFTFFSMALVFDVKMLTKTLREQGGFIAGKRPGEETAVYLHHTSRRVGALGAVYLTVIALVTLYLFPEVGVSGGSFGATSIIILATVVVTLLAALEAELSATVKHRGFLTPGEEKKGRGFKAFTSRKASRKPKAHEGELKSFLGS